MEKSYENINKFIAPNPNLNTLISLCDAIVNSDSQFNLTMNYTLDLLQDTYKLRKIFIQIPIEDILIIHNIYSDRKHEHDWKSLFVRDVILEDELEDGKDPMLLDPIF
jgi:hypothetical protein